MKKLITALCITLGLSLIILGVAEAVERAASKRSEAAETPPPTVAPTTPAPTPTPEPTEEPFVITEHWFDDAVFIGDSVTSPLFYYTLSNGGLGNAVISYANGYSCHKKGPDALKLPYKGHGYNAEDLVAETGAGKVFFLMAMNDLGQPMDTLRQCWLDLIDRVREKSPEVDIYIQSGTPIYDQGGDFTNENVALLNEMIQELCEETGCVYVDIARGLADETGCLKEEYHLDFVHFSDDTGAIWVENLKDISCYSVPPTE